MPQDTPQKLMTTLAAAHSRQKTTGAGSIW